MLPKGLYNHTKFATYFLNMGLTPLPPFEQCSKKMRIWWRMSPLSVKSYHAETHDEVTYNFVQPKNSNSGEKIFYEIISEEAHNEGTQNEQYGDGGIASS